MTQQQQQQQQDKEVVRADPAQFLDQDCLSHVFSFVGGRTHNYKSPDQYTRLSSSKRPSKKSKPSPRRIELELPGPASPYWTPREAAALVHTLASVSKAWRDVVDQSMNRVVSVPLDLALPPESVAGCLAWVTHHRLKLGRVQMPPIIPAEVEEEDAWMRLFQQCDTTHLRDLEVTLVLKKKNDLEVALEQSSFGSELQTTMAQQCSHHLERLSVHVVAEKEDYTVPPGFLSPTLFSLPSLTEIEVSLTVTKPMQQQGLDETDGLALNQLIRDVPGLAPLEEDTLHLMSQRRPNELRFEPISGEDTTLNTPKCFLGLVCGKHC